jgi:hypothetical protein
MKLILLKRLMRENFPELDKKQVLIGKTKIFLRVMASNTIEKKFAEKVDKYINFFNILNELFLIDYG